VSKDISDVSAQIQRLLDGFDGEHSIKKLFWTHLSYDRVRDPLSPDFLPPATKKSIQSLEVFAASEARTIVYAALNKLLDGSQLEQMAWAIERKIPNSVVLLYDSKRWSLVYPDEAAKPHVRMLAIPGPIGERHKTARQLAALDAVHQGSGDEVHTFESAEKLDVFFPGVMPHLDDLLNDFERYANHRDPEMRDLLPFIREIGQFPFLTLEQQRGEDLAGNEQPPDGCSFTYQQWRLITHNLRMVVWIATKCRRMGMTLSDLVQEGCIGLMIAAKRYEPERGNRFTTYAFQWIRQTMYRGMHNQCNLIRWPVWRAVKLIPASFRGDEEGLSAGEKPVRFMPWNFTRMSLFGTDPVAFRSLEQLQVAIQVALSSLEPREEDVIRRRYGFGGNEEETLQDIGDRYRFTREYIRQIEKKALGKLQGHLSFALMPHVEALEARMWGRRDHSNINSFRAFQDYMQGLHSTATGNE
jgi:RNA polymerase sigma factor (sigma-70 family)